MLRNGSLHSFTPRGVYETTRNSCIGCGLDYRLDPAGTGHLEFTSNDSLYVDGTKFVQELVDSMGVYADYLDRNVPDQPGGPTPQDNFREGWFSRFRPRGPNGENPAVWTY
ncbi:MAG: hypothetical protein ACRENE_27565 [Polyangiaceae bacterium]